uniref:Calcitonin gene-related peptide type 1 receptor n=1 Tax=Malurus cyaneus samueli TaxID=2593467 RepID=A0A8C5U7F3_9PASS
DFVQLSVTRNKIMTAQYECYQKIMQDPIRQHNGSFCNRTWDGWLCWSDVRAGSVSVQRCPDYFQDFNPSEKVTKICDSKGNWFRHPESNRTWTNYTQCNIYTHEKVKTALNLYYLAIIGHGLSIASLLISLGIFFYFKSLSCQRITLHKNLFFSFVCNSVVTIISLTAVANNQELVATNPVSCKVSQFIYLYLMGCNYFWMLCEGIYLHTLIVVAVFAEKQHLMWYYLLGWGIAASSSFKHPYFCLSDCWISSDTHLLYIIHGPICAALLVNLFFLLNIVRVLITKLKDTHKAESNLYMKAVRATLILVPLLGIEFVLFPWRPEGRIAEEVYDYVMHILMHYQPRWLMCIYLFIFFLSGAQVQAVLRRHWNQYKIQFEHSFSHSDAMRTASYTVSSISDVQGYGYSHDCTSEHLNGKNYHDMDISTV